MESTGTAVAVKPVEAAVELDHQEMIIAADFDQEELEALMGPVPTQGCSGGGGTSVFCGSVNPGRPGPI
ncbi:hypothetical protein AB0L35_04725 [Streptomyces sp. NPDC052309]|uniref:hypothetical protein n=1 Tax=Streptomyces sp. NPDC052309 TaxID=3155421 RepID=UPI003429BF77